MSTASPRTSPTTATASPSTPRSSRGPTRTERSTSSSSSVHQQARPSAPAGLRAEPRVTTRASFASLSEDGTYVAFQSDATNLMRPPTPTGIGHLRSWMCWPTGRTTGSASWDAARHRGRRRQPASGDLGERSLCRLRVGRDEFLRPRRQRAVGRLRTPDTSRATRWSWSARRPPTRPALRAGRASSNASHILGPSSISADGRFVAFGSSGSDFVGGDTNEQRDAFVRDRERGRDAARERKRRRGSKATTLAVPGGGRRPDIHRRESALPSSPARPISCRFETNGVQQVYVREEAPPAAALRHRAGRIH